MTMTDGDGDDFDPGTTSASIASTPAASLTESSLHADADPALLSRLALIDGQPLGDRAAAFRQVHDELRQQLEASDGDAGRSA
jgi:hypothetical protein